MKKLKSFSIGLLTIFFYVFFQLLVFDFFNIETNNYYLKNILYLGPIITTSLIFFLIYHKSLIKHFKEFDFEDLTTSLKYWIYAIILMYLTTFLISPFTNDIAITEEANRSLLTAFPLYSVFSMGIFAPFCEEICFRFSFKDAFKNRWVYVILTSLFFGLAHINSFNFKEFLFVIPYSVMGGALALAYFDTKNIFASIFMHMFNNVVMIFLLIVGGSLF